MEYRKPKTLSTDCSDTHVDEGKIGARMLHHNPNLILLLYLKKQK
jgi:hypothetical protein